MFPHHTRSFLLYFRTCESRRWLWRCPVAAQFGTCNLTAIPCTSPRPATTVRSCSGICATFTAPNAPCRVTTEPSYRSTGILRPATGEFCSKFVALFCDLLFESGKVISVIIVYISSIYFFCLNLLLFCYFSFFPLKVRKQKLNELKASYCWRLSSSESNYWLLAASATAWWRFGSFKALHGRARRKPRWLTPWGKLNGDRTLDVSKSSLATWCIQTSTCGTWVVPSCHSWVSR